MHKQQGVESWDLQHLSCCCLHVELIHLWQACRSYGWELGGTTTPTSQQLSQSKRFLEFYPAVDPSLAAPTGFPNISTGCKIPHAEMLSSCLSRISSCCNLCDEVPHRLSEAESIEEASKVNQAAKQD